VGFVTNKVAMGQVLSRILQFSVVSFIKSTLIYRLADKQQTQWWPQFRDIISPNRYEQDKTKKNMHVSLLDCDAVWTCG
jgi:hypothetical protein